MSDIIYYGLLCEICYQGADIGMGHYSYTHDRAQVADYGISHYQVVVTFGTSTPRSRLPVNLITLPFTPPVWLCVLVAYLGLMAFLRTSIILVPDIPSKWILHMTTWLCRASEY